MKIIYVLAVDPGQATGVAIGRYTDELPLKVIFTGIINGGTYGFSKWLDDTNDCGSIIDKHMCDNALSPIGAELRVVSENFKLRGGNFAPDLEPLRIEGVLIDHFWDTSLSWQAPADKGLVGDEFLKRHNLWLTGKDVDHTDGRDANDALLHLFAFAMKTKHRPTLEAYWRS
jgi:hypothetical protein